MPVRHAAIAAARVLSFQIEGRLRFIDFRSYPPWMLGPMAENAKLALEDRPLGHPKAGNAGVFCHPKQSFPRQPGACPRATSMPDVDLKNQITLGLYKLTKFHSHPHHPALLEHDRKRSCFDRSLPPNTTQPHCPIFSSINVHQCSQCIEPGFIPLPFYDQFPAS